MIDGALGWFPNACPNHQHPTYPAGVGIKHAAEPTLTG